MPACCMAAVYAPCCCHGHVVYNLPQCHLHRLRVVREAAQDTCNHGCMLPQLQVHCSSHGLLHTCLDTCCSVVCKPQVVERCTWGLLSPQQLLRTCRDHTGHRVVVEDNLQQLQELLQPLLTLVHHQGPQVQTDLICLWTRSGLWHCYPSNCIQLTEEHTCNA